MGNGTRGKDVYECGGKVNTSMQSGAVHNFHDIKSMRKGTSGSRSV